MVLLNREDESQSNLNFGSTSQSALSEYQMCAEKIWNLIGIIEDVDVDENDAGWVGEVSYG